MQSGITASQELHDAFNTLVSSFPAQRGLIAGIKNEKLLPLHTITSSSTDFFDDLQTLESIVKDNEAAYIILRRYPNAPDGFVAVTYVPDTANVRQKMLFASTRLTLVRELGTERFRETLFATTKQELTAEGWQKHEKSGELSAPLTAEEQSLEGVKAAEAEASRGTTTKASHVSGGINFPVSEDALQALRGLPTSNETLVQLKIDVAKETIELAGSSVTDAKGLGSSISDSEPRYSFFRHAHNQSGQEQSPIIFIYTCPPSSKVKERMLYATSWRGAFYSIGKDAGLEIGHKLEASSPSEITAAVVHEELYPKHEEKQAFSRPKRPGKR